MKYVANPVVVDAFEIVSIGAIDEDKNLMIELPYNVWNKCSLEMRSRYSPKIGDYWVVQSDGYIYLNPKEVFERKYHPLGETKKENDCEKCGAPSMSERTEQIMKSYQDGIRKVIEETFATFEKIELETTFGGVV